MTKTPTRVRILMTSSSGHDDGDRPYAGLATVLTGLPRMIRRHEHQLIIPLADSTTFEMEKRGEFPLRFNLSPRCVVWDLAEIEAWLQQRRSVPIWERWLMLALRLARKAAIAALSAAPVLFEAGVAFGHPGGLNAEGCHNDRKNGGYHCHRAQSASASPSRRQSAMARSGNEAFANCSAARTAGAAPVRAGDPGYGRHLDRDGDGIGCE